MCIGEVRTRPRSESMVVCQRHTHAADWHRRASPRFSLSDIVGGSTPWSAKGTEDTRPGDGGAGRRSDCGLT
jgi:hypothetical protein